VARCQRIKADGERCRGVPIDGSEWCAAHHPATQEKRLIGARRGGRLAGRGRPLSGGELAEVKQILADACSQLLKPPGERDLDRQDAVVLSQLCNTRLRALETERRTVEHDDLLQRLEELEAAAVKVTSGAMWTR
jgi:hypothetical protein